MSTVPHPEGVAEILKLLRSVEVLQAEAAELRPKIERLKVVEERIREDCERLGPLMRSMDVETPGNGGWGSRFGWLLAEMRRQIIQTQKQGGR